MGRRRCKRPGQAGLPFGPLAGRLRKASELQVSCLSQPYKKRLAAAGDLF